MKERYFNCDVLRIIAFIFVIAIHSLSYLGFYNQIKYYNVMFECFAMLIYYLCTFVFSANRIFDGK